MKRSDFTVGNPLPFTCMKTRCDRAAFVLSDYLSLAQEQAIITEEVIRSCKGLVFISVVKGAYLWSGRIGSGLLVGKLPNGEWAPPSALCCFGVGYGAQVGLEFTDYVIVLRDEHSLSAFSQMGNLTIGANLCLAFGPWGRNAEIDMAVTFGLGYSLSKSRGLFAGISLEGMLLLENGRTNEACYGKFVTAKKLVAGEFQPNQEVAGLMQALHARFGSPLSPSLSSPNSSSAAASAAASASASSYASALKEKEHLYQQQQQEEMGYQRWSAHVDQKDPDGPAPSYYASTSAAPASSSSSPYPPPSSYPSSSSAAAHPSPQYEPASLAAAAADKGAYPEMPLADETAGLLGSKK